MKVKITIHGDLSDITLGQYQEFLLKAEGLEHTSSEMQQLIVSSFCGVRIEEVNKMTMKDVKEISDHINLLFSVEQPFIKKFEMEGVEFGFIPDLDSISFGEYVDLDSYATDWKNAHKTISVLYRPIANTFRDKYTVQEYNGTDEYAEMMKFTPLNIAISAKVFFYHLGRDLLRCSADYLKEQMRLISTAKNTNSDKNTDGIIQSINSLEETLGTLMKSPDLKPPKLSLF